MDRSRVGWPWSVVLVCVVLSACSSDTPPEPETEHGKLCAQAPHDRLCSFLPQDVLDDLPDAYQGIAPELQRPFDEFSWQMFVALNWPATPDGTPLESSIRESLDAPRVWESYPTPFDVFGAQPDGRRSDPPECEGIGSSDAPIFQLFAKSGSRPELADFLEATGQPLIDRNLNFVLYDIRMNPIEAAYIRSNGLQTAAGQKAFQAAGDGVSFPLGFYTDPEAAEGGSPGAIEIKTAWRILDPATGDDLNDFYHLEARVYVPAGESESGEALCFDATLGLVGFHVLQRTSDPTGGGAQQSWNWATFEHVDNAPLATNAGDPAGDDPGPPTCDPPPDEGKLWSFFNPACAGCASNQPPPQPSPGASYLWATSPPFAARYATDGFGTQVVACWKIYPETEARNVVFQDALQGTPWANYRLINTQWQSSLDEPPFTRLSIPRYLGNPVLETYIQPTADCLGCHTQATTTAGQSANFSFLLSFAQ